MSGPIGLAERLNRDCDCVVTDVPALQQKLIERSADETHAHLFAEVPVFVAKQHVRDMQRVIRSVESVSRLPGYREQVLARAPAIARNPPRHPGVFFGYDFHVAADGPKLIEINTNAGGALLNVEAQGSQRACCPGVADSPGAAPCEARKQAIVRMFEREWRLARGDAPLRTMAIVDDEPERQYLFPEFRLFKELLDSQGIRTLIADARELTIENGCVMHDGQRIDLVYNRCTDFYFEDAAHAVLAEAYQRDLAVITPHPFAHALYSNKENLVLLSDANALRAIHVPEADIEVLTRAIPRTLRVEGPEQTWWEQRKRWFFKPSAGFGSRGAYRGDKITRRVFSDVLRGGYIAQELTPPSERNRSQGGAFKLDVRNYVYDGETQVMAARLFQGQTTNFRTPGGGFAPVYELG